MSARYAFQKPRTDASVTRLSLLSAPRHPSRAPPDRRLHRRCHAARSRRRSRPPSRCSRRDHQVGLLEAHQALLGRVVGESRSGPVQIGLSTPRGTIWRTAMAVLDLLQHEGREHRQDLQRDAVVNSSKLFSRVGRRACSRSRSAMFCLAYSTSFSACGRSPNS